MNLFFMLVQNLSRINLFSNGGRVLNITSLGKSFKNIRKKIFKTIKKINWKNGFFRKDIGWRVIEKKMRIIGGKFKGKSINF